MGNISSLTLPLLPQFRHAPFATDLKGARRLIARFEKLQQQAAAGGGSSSGSGDGGGSAAGFGYAINYDMFKALYKQTSQHHNGNANGAAAELAPSSSAASLLQANNTTSPSPSVDSADSLLLSAWSIWDPLQRNRTDVLQIFASSILTSTATFNEKVTALFELFDMDCNAYISRDEMCIMIRAALCGYCRVIGATPPPTQELNDIARLAFKSADRQDKKDNKIELKELIIWANVTHECFELVGKFNTSDIEEVRAINAGTSSGKSNNTRRSTMILPPAVLTSSADGSTVLIQADQNMSSIIDDAIQRERELNKTKPALPTQRELNQHGEKMKMRKEMCMEGGSGEYHHETLHSPTASNGHTHTSSSSHPSHHHPSSSSSSTSNNSTVLTTQPHRWEKKISEFIFLRKCFEACEIPGSGIPVANQSIVSATSISTHEQQTNGSSTSRGVSSNGPRRRTESSMSPRKASAANGKSSSGFTSPLSSNHHILSSSSASKHHTSSSSSSSHPSSHSSHSSHHPSYLRATIPGTGSAQLVVFGSYMRSLNLPRWKKLPSFRTVDGPIQAGQDVTFRDVIRSYYPEYVSQSKRDLDLIVASTDPGVRPSIPRSLIEKLGEIYDGVRKKEEKEWKEEEVLMQKMNEEESEKEVEGSGSTEKQHDGLVSLNSLLTILRPSKKLQEYIDVNELDSHASGSGGHDPLGGMDSPTPARELDKRVTLQELLSILFSKSHQSQMEEILTWCGELPAAQQHAQQMTPTQLRDLRTLFQMYDPASTGTISIEDMREGLLKQFSQEQVTFLLASYAPSVTHIYWKTFQQVYKKQGAMHGSTSPATIATTKLRPIAQVASVEPKHAHTKSISQHQHNTSVVLPRLVRRS